MSVGLPLVYAVRRSQVLHKARRTKLPPAAAPGGSVVSDVHRLNRRRIGNERELSGLDQARAPYATYPYSTPVRARLSGREGTPRVLRKEGDLEAQKGYSMKIVRPCPDDPRFVVLRM